MAPKWKHFRSFEVIIRLVILFRISGRLVSRSLTFLLETKMQWRQTPSQKKKAVMFTTDESTYQGQLNAGFSKVCEIFKVCGIKSLKYVRVLHTGLLLWWHFHTPKRDVEQNELWLVVGHVCQMASWVGLGQWKLPWIPDLQPSVLRTRGRLPLLHVLGTVDSRTPDLSFCSRILKLNAATKQWIAS